MDIEQRALELVKQHGGQYGPALEAAIEAGDAERAAHDAFRQEVSEFALGVKEYMASVGALTWQQDCDRFIIQPKTDPLTTEDAVKMFWDCPADWTVKQFREHLEQRGYKHEARP